MHMICNTEQKILLDREESYTKKLLTFRAQESFRPHVVLN
jgi:hypothetical protein